jgi:P27 family predicted phage terminase small subunit
MGKRGPKPGTQPRSTTRPVVTSGVPKMPRGMSDNAVKCWKRIVADLDAMKILGQLDWNVLKAGCEAWSEREDAAAEWSGIPREDRYVAMSNGAVCVHPAWKTYQEAERLWLSYADRLGLSPQARGRIQLQANPDGTQAEPNLDDLDDPKKLAAKLRIKHA